MCTDTKWILGNFESGKKTILPNVKNMLFFFVFLSSILSASQHNYLAQVTSNIWGTKFKIVGLASFLPANLGAGKHHKSHTYTSQYSI